MRRTSFLLAFAAIALLVVVGATYKIRKDRLVHGDAHIAPSIKSSERGVALQGWDYSKDDPATNRPVVRVRAESFRATDNPSAFELRGLALKLFDKKDSSYTYVKAERGIFDERSGVLVSDGPVSIVVNVPVDKDAENKDELAKRVQVLTSGVHYDTRSFKASTDQAATFIYPDGSGKAVGVEYDPATKNMHLKSQVVLDRNGMHVEAGDLVYNEGQEKVYLSPWSKLQRGPMTIQAKNSVITLVDRKVHQIDAEHPAGVDERNGRHVEYTADKMTALFDDYGNMTEVHGDNNAHVISLQKGAKTVLSGDRANLRFALETSVDDDGQEYDDSFLQSVTAEGHAVAESQPLPQPNRLLADTRILRSEHIELQMKPGGQDVQAIHSPVKSQLEFKPNRPGLPRRTLDASRMDILYGESSYVDTFLGWNVATRTDKPALPGQKTVPPPSFTWSDEMRSKFEPNSSDISKIEQSGNFRYEEGPRKASSNKAILEQKLNRITLIDRAKVLDENGSAAADLIVMNQTTGDMDASGHVLSTHAPDKNAKPGTSMLDPAQTLQAKADKMQTTESNSRIFYDGHAVMWQGANRISAEKIDIDRDEQTIHASGGVVTELVDNKTVGDSIYTTVKAPDLVYRDDTREALYTGGVVLIRKTMTVNSNQLRAFLSPKTNSKNDDSSLDHAFADGDFKVVNTMAAGHKRAGSAAHGEYYTKEDKVILSGGEPEITDSLRGFTRGKQITYFNGDDRLIVEGEVKKVAFTRMTKK